MKRLNHTALIGWVALCAICEASKAYAGNDDEVLLGNNAALTSGAVTAVVRDGSAIWYNPAGLAGVLVDTLDASGSAFVLRHHRVPSILSASSGESAGGDITEFVSIPSALTYVRPLSDRVRVGLGIFVTRASDLSLETTLAIEPTPLLPVKSEVLLALTNAQNTYHAGVSVAWRAMPNFWVGASLLAFIDQIDASVLYTGGTVEPLGPSGGVLFNQSQLLRSNVIGLLMNVGVQWQVSSRLRLGLSVNSPSYAVYSSFSAPTAVAGVIAIGDQPAFAFVPRRFESSEFQFSAYAPARVRLGLAYTLDRLWIALDADVRPAMRSSLALERALTWNVRLGGRFAVSESISIGVGGFTDRSPRPDQLGFGDLNQDFYGFTVGGEYATALKLAEKEPSDAVRFSTTLGFRYAYGRGQLGGLRAPDIGDDISDFQANPTRLTTHELGVHLGSSLLF